MELYKIYCGETLLNNKAIHFAKKELENRDFDFNNISEFIKNWENKMNSERENEKKEKAKYGIKDSLGYYSLIFSGITTVFLILIDSRYDNFRLFGNDFDSQVITLVILLGIALMVGGTIGLIRNQNRKKNRLIDNRFKQNIRNNNR